MTKVDKEKCIGCGACASICENGFEMKDGKAQIKDPEAECIKEGKEVCPVNAIII